MNLRGSILLGLLLGAFSYGQWLSYSVPGIPRKADGRPDLMARTQKARDGKPDLSGIWQAQPDRIDTPQGTNGEDLPKYFLDITRDLPSSAVPFHPWAAELYRERSATHAKDDPISRCLPLGVPRSDADALPFKIIQTSNHVVMLHEGDGSFRQIFLDGRPLPKDPQPSWRGYSVGRWEKDVLVVDTIGFNDKGWLDAFGHPHSDAMKVTERLRRPNFGHLEIRITIDDPKTYRQPLTYTQMARLDPDNELIETVCNENERDSKHLVGQ